MFDNYRRLKKASEAAAEAIERCDKLESELKRLRLEWEDTYDRLTRVVQRIAKRAEVVEKAQQSDEAQQPALPLHDYPNMPPAQAAAQARILARRRKLMGERTN